MSDVFEIDIQKLFKKAKLKDDQVLRFVLLPDIHVPKHDTQVLKAVEQFLQDYKPHGLIQLGDFLDLGSMSHWEGACNINDLLDDLSMGRKVLESLTKAAGKQLIFKGMCSGNHELWLKQTLTERVPELEKLIKHVKGSIEIPDLLGLKELDYEFVDYNDFFKIGHLYMTHGIFAGANPCKKHLQVVGENVAFGHTETIGIHMDASINGLHAGFNIGTMRQLDEIKFLKKRPTAWCHGFAIVEFRKDGKFTILIPPIVEGLFSFNGKLYGGK